MAREKWTASDSVTQGELRPGRTERTSTVPPPSANELESARRELEKNGCEYQFYYVVGMLERLTPGAVRVGGDGPYGDEQVRFRHDHSLSFSPGEITSVRYLEKHRRTEDLLDKKQHRFELTTSFLGLTGSCSPLPSFMAEEIAQAQASGDVQRDFIDMFHHRFISFVYRIGVKYDLAREYSRDASDRWSRRILALAGVDTWGEGGRPKHISPWRLLRLSPLLAGCNASARNLELALTDLLEESLGEAWVRIEQFCGDWTDLDPDQQMRLDQRNHSLGLGSVLGVRCFDRAGKAKVVIGPLQENFRRFLADGDMFPVVVEILDRMTTEPVEFELELVLSQEARPPFHLGDPKVGRMGVDAWLSSRSGPAEETRVTVALPRKVPDPGTGSAFGWQSKPQR